MLTFLRTHFFMLTVLLLAPMPARAEGGVVDAACSSGRVGFSPMDGASLPASFRELLVTPSIVPVGMASVSVTRIDGDGTRTPLAFTAGFRPAVSRSVVTPSAPLVAGTRLEVSVQRVCDMWDTATYTIVADAPLPTSIGPIRASAEPWVFVDRSSHVHVHVELDSPGPWGEAWSGLTTLDGVSDFGRIDSLAAYSASAGGVTIDLQTTCPGYSGAGIDPRTYTLRLAAGPWSPDPTVAAVEATTTVDIPCPGPFDGGMTIEAGTTLDGGTTMDGGTSMDAELGTHDPSNGCPCATTTVPHGGWLATLPLALLLFGRRRR